MTDPTQIPAVCGSPPQHNSTCGPSRQLPNGGPAPQGRVWRTWSGKLNLLRIQNKGECKQERCMWRVNLCVYCLCIHVYLFSTSVQGLQYTCMNVHVCACARVYARVHVRACVCTLFACTFTCVLQACVGTCGTYACAYGARA